MIAEQARGRPEEQVVGVLIGRLQNQVVVVEDAVSGDMQTDATHAVLTGETIAKIADDIINRKIKGNVIGWYHSHVKDGVFMSETDVETQLKLQQFSPYITAMVIDTQSGESGFYRADPKAKTAVRIPDRNIHVYTLGQDPVPDNWKRAAMPEPGPPGLQQYGPPGPQPYRPPLQPDLKTIGLVGVLIAVILVGVLAAAYYYGGPLAGGTLKIEHTPVARALIGNAITIRANVTGGGIENVTLRFIAIKAAEEESADWVSRNLRLEAAGQDVYSYDIPGPEVNGDIAYLIVAFASGSRNRSTETYRIAVADFDFADDQTIEPIVVRGKSTTFEVETIAKSGFSQQVSLRVDNRPAGVSLTFPNTFRPPGAITFTVRAIADAELGFQEMLIIARFSVGAIQIERTQKVKLLVTDFALDVSPTLLKIDRTDCQQPKFDKRVCELTLSITVYHGYTDPINIEVRGLPKGVSYILVYDESRLVPEGVVKIRLIFITTSTVILQTYQLTIVASSAGISDSETVNLEVDD